LIFLNVNEKIVKIEEILKKSGSTEFLYYKSGGIIFSSGDAPINHFYLNNGDIKLISKQGYIKQLIFGNRHCGEGIADFMIFTDDVYPFTAVALSDCEIYKIAIVDYLLLMDEHPEISAEMLRSMSKILYHNVQLSDIYFIQDSAEKLISFMNYLKRNETDQRLYSFQIYLTRKEIASLVGLRVETVIRTIKKLEKQKLLKIINRKIFY